MGSIPGEQIFQNAVFLYSWERISTEFFKNSYIVVIVSCARFKMAKGRITAVSLLVGLFSSLTAYLEINLALLNVQADYGRRRLNIIN